MGSVVSGLGSALGLGGGVQAPSLTNPTNSGQLGQAFNNTQNSLQQQQELLKALQAQNGTQNQSQVYNQLQQVASGQGPNPAQAMLNNATGQNVANQAALAAGQRGSSANAGLIARQAGQIGANAQQQAVGQGAALQANQALGAMQAAGNIAGQQVGNQLSANQLYSNSALQGQQNLIGAQQGFNNAQNQQYGTQLQNQQQQGGNLMNTVGGIANAAGPALATIFGGPIAGAAAGAVLGGGNTNSARPGADTIMPFAEGGQVPATPKSHFGMYAHGGKVDALTAPGERYLPPSEVKAVAQGHKSPMQAGHVIPGKPVVGGAKDSYANDIVPKKLDVGGVVLPRSVTQAPDKDQKAREFVAAILKQKAMKAKK